MENEQIEKEKQPQSAKESFWELVRFAFIALLIVLPIRILVAEPFVVSGSSMIPTFQNGDYLIIDKMSYKLNEPKRNDIVVFRYPNDQTKFFIKRIIGLPNETVNIEGSVITIINEEHQNGFSLDQPYVESVSDNTVHFELKDDEYFVMGDNRRASSDSRYWGAVARKSIKGRVLLRLFPIKNMSILPGSYQQAE